MKFLKAYFIQSNATALKSVCQTATISTKNCSAWITAALRNEQFFSLAELNRAIREKLEQFNRKLFQKKEGSRLDLFLEDEKPLLSPLPATRFELSDWKIATVQFNYHISVDGMLIKYDKSEYNR